MNGVPGRYLRYILFAILGIAILHFIASASLPIPSASDLANGLTPSKGGEGGQTDTNSQTKPETETSNLESTPSAIDSSPQIPQKPQDKQETQKPQETPTKQNTQATPSAEVSIQASDRVNATFVTLARNSDLWEIAKSIRQVEDRFNRNHGYDWVFLNDAEFNDEFKKVTTALISGKTHYGVIPKDHWSFPDFIDQDKAAEVREEMKEKKVIYGDSISYRHMCRYESGFFFRHELMQQFDYYWRVEPSVEYFCDIAFDPFKVMKEQKKKYSFVISLHEYRETVATIWDSVKKFMKNHPQHIADNNNMEFVSEDGGESYNLCHFWSNFEVGDLNWLRSQAYLDFFNTLDKDGGFYYERWGDAPVHSIAAALLLKKEEVHFFNEIAYRHVPFVHCPTGEQLRLDLKCHCNPSDNFDWKGYSCTSRYFETNKMEKPKGWDNQSD